jgi:hypothetical protein
MQGKSERGNDRLNPANRPDADDPGNDKHQHDGGRKSGQGDRGVDDDMGGDRRGPGSGHDVPRR